MDSNIQKYLALLSAVECGSFTGAAEKLNYSQPGISRMVRDIEVEWGITLLERYKGGVKLTSEGMRLMPFIKNLCSEYTNLESEIDNINGLKTGVLKIAATSCVASKLLPDTILKFSQSYPGITYEVKTGDYCDIEKWISDGTVDCGFVSITKDGEIKTNKIIAVHSIIKDELLAVVPEGNYSGVFPLDAFNGRDFLLPDDNVNAEISEYIKVNNLQPNIRFTSWDDGAILRLVESGFGITIMPELNVRRTAYNIKALHLEKPAFRKLAFAYRSDRAVSAVVREFAIYVSEI